MIELSAYKKEWPVTYLEFKNKLLSHADDLIVDMEHIGSTSIKGVEAKNIIDIQLAIKSFSQIDELKVILESMGFSYLNSIKQDHVPFHDFDYFSPKWEKRFFKGTFHNQAMNIHVRLKDSANWNFAIKFRDFLSTNEKARYAFMQFKQRLANSQVNREDYCIIKDSVIDLMSLQFGDD